MGPTRATLAQGPVCDRCGRAEPDRYRFCPDCELFVCAECWDPASGVCLSSSRPNLPAPGLLPISIRNTIGQRSAGVSLSASRVGQALVGPAAPTVLPASPAAAPASAAGRRSRRWSGAGAGALLILATIVVITIGLLAVPALANLLSNHFASPPPGTASTPAGNGGGRSAAPAAPAGRKYVVRPGDTLRSIAAQVYGDAGRWSDLYQANRKTIGDPDSLDVGTTLNVP